MKILDLATTISLILTVPTIVLALLVLKEWKNSALKALKANSRTSIDWLILGVWVSFFGASLDNLWWGVAWSTHYVGAPESQWWFSHGSTANIFVRQGCGCFAAYCHLRSSKAFGLVECKKSIRKLNHLLIVTNVAGVVFWGILYLLKNG